MPLIYPTAFFGGGGTIDFPTLRGTATHNGGQTVTLPSGTIAGDLVVMFGYFFGIDGLAVINVQTPADWERLGHIDISSSAELNVYVTRATGALSSVALTAAPGSDAFAAICNAYSFSKHSRLAAVSSISMQLSTSSPNPPSLTVPGEWGSNAHVMWLSCLYKFGASTTNSASSGYSNLIGTTDGTARMASARLNSRATTEDPGAWSISAANGGIPFTIAVRGPE